MGVQCLILLHKPKNGVYRPGQPVIGTLKYAIDKPTKYQSIVLSIIGKGKCKWSETTSTTNANGESSSTTDTFSGKEEYLQYHISVLKKSSNYIKIEPGTYEQFFRFDLPQNIPSTYEDKVGSIKYKIIANFSKHNFFGTEKSFESEITIRSYVYSPERPVIINLNKTLFKPFSRKVQNVNVRMEMLEACLRPGRNADIKFIINNDSDIDTLGVTLYINSLTTYTANGKTKTKEKTVLGTKTSQGVLKNSVAQLLTKIYVPAELYSIQHSRVVKRDYYLKVTVNLPTPHFDKSAKIPIVIGEKQIIEHQYQTLQDPPPPYWKAMLEMP